MSVTAGTKSGRKFSVKLADEDALQLHIWFKDRGGGSLLVRTCFV
jgi:hypothetical protein